MSAIGHALALGLALGCAVVAGPVHAAVPASARALDIRQTSMPRALAELARETGVELLFDQRLVRNLRARPVRGRLSVDAALTALLAGSGIGHRATPDGAFVLFILPTAPVPEPSDGAIAEILVVGRRTQNADIRRTPNDIQGYKVTSRREIEASHADNLDQFLRNREPANVQIRTASQEPTTQFASTRSQIDLRGFGTQRTLVLVDGRRMPHLPTGQGEFDQGDLNGIPLGAIERVETLTSTAGGIYGPGAIGGVVNIVLRRDYRGADFTVVGGLTDRGDADRGRLEARIGFTPDDGDTDVMLFAAYAASRPLLVGERDYATRAREIVRANDPAAYLASLPTGNGVSVYGASNLVLDPQFGGTALGASYTFLPIDFTGTPAERSAVLVANSGKLAPGLAEDESTALRSLVTGSEIVSGLGNIRRRVGDGVELYLDGMYARGVGKVTASGGPVLFAVTGANAVNNPFAQAVRFRFPTPATEGGGTTRTQVARVSLGAIATLPGGWSGTGDYTVGRSIVQLRTLSHDLRGEFDNAIGSGVAGPFGLPALDPLGDWQTFVAASRAYLVETRSWATLRNNLSDVSLRLAGPVLSLPGGPLTLTVLGEARREHMPGSTAVIMFSSGLIFPFVLPDRARAVRSGYAELRAPLTARDGDVFFLPGLELQLAVRYDASATTLPVNAVALTPSNDRLTTVREEAAVYTVGARVFPLPVLMLRASLATGELPPDISDLQASATVIAVSPNVAPDPKRGGRDVLADGPYTALMNGSHDVRSEQGRTVAVGAVLDLSKHGGPRVSADYSRVSARGEITTFNLSAAQLLAAEDAYPGRVVRLPLTDADRAAGFTGGRVISMDFSKINAGKEVVEAVDLSLDWMLPASRVGDVRLYGNATWLPRATRQDSPQEPKVDRIGYAESLLAWRGNAGVEWTRGPLTLELNAQYFDRYRVIPPGPSNGRNADILRYQGATHFPRQVYLDLAARRRFEVDGNRLRSVEVRLGVQNILDKSPPIDADLGTLRYYSPYGDPRRRRVELAISSQF